MNAHALDIAARLMFGAAGLFAAWTMLRSIADGRRKIASLFAELRAMDRQDDLR